MRGTAGTDRLTRRATFARVVSEQNSVLTYLRDTFSSERAHAERMAEVRRAVVILGSPRGGTSAVAAALRATDGALALPGEHRYLFTLLGRNHPDGGDAECDPRPLSVDERSFLLDRIGADVEGADIETPDREQLDVFAWRWALRFRLQWPLVEVPVEHLADAAADVARRSYAHGRPERGRLTLQILYELRRRLGVDVEPHFYDVDRSLVDEVFGPRPLPEGPPTGTIIEISPYVALAPTTRPAIAPDARLVLKSSSDCYRVSSLVELFAGWDVRYVHLTRNVAAAVNGLLDGWAHHCFWQHDLQPAGMPLSKRRGRRGAWWKFDLFDGWRELYHAPLEDICAAQWLSSHERILRHATSTDVLRVPFEPFQLGRASRAALLERCVEFLGLDAGGVGAAALAPPIVNGTVPPASARWRSQRPELVSLANRPRVREMSVRLGYGTDAGSWT